MAQRASPVDYLYELRAHCSPAKAHRSPHEWIRLFTTPVPAVIAMMLTDALPLQPPSRGLAHSHAAWVRVWMCGAIVAFTVVLKLNRFVPAAAVHSWLAIARVVVFTASGTVAWVLWLSTRVGYPLPFTINLGQPIFSVVFATSTIHAVGWQRLCSQWHTLLTLLAVLIVQIVQTAIYPIVQYAFSYVDLPLLPFVLPVVKYGFKRVFALIMRRSPELKPVTVVFNAEVFHALYVSLAMQSSSSGWTPVLFIAIDLLGVAYTFVHLHRRVRRLQQLVPSGGQILDCAMFLLRDPKTRKAFQAIVDPRLSRTTRGKSSAIVTVFPINVVPATPDGPIVFPPADSLASEETLPPALEAQLRQLEFPHRKAYVQQTIELLNATETFMLAEYVEVIVPVVYSIYASVISQLPNLAFYPQLRELTPAAYRRTIGTVLLYAVLELATFLPLDRILRRRLGFRPMRQLTLVLQNEALLVAAELTLLLVYMVQVSLDHFGNDFTFRFTWLQDHRDQRP